ncbi:MAG: hypothetical protein R2697_06840 [Ilumatobacteraceae bacterium]
MRSIANGFGHSYGVPPACVELPGLGGVALVLGDEPFHRRQHVAGDGT